MDFFKTIVDDKHYITFKVISDVIDFRFSLGEECRETTIEKLNLYSGKAVISPFWSFGFQQCRYGYKDITYLEDVVTNYEKYGLPLDTI
jgi:alpha-glucosidase